MLEPVTGKGSIVSFRLIPPWPRKSRKGNIKAKKSSRLATPHSKYPSFSRLLPFSEDYGKNFKDITNLINNTFIRTEFGMAIGPENSGKVRLIPAVWSGYRVRLELSVSHWACPCSGTPPPTRPHLVQRNRTSSRCHSLWAYGGQ